MSISGRSVDAPWRILVVDDDERSAQNNATALNQASNSAAVPYPVEAVATESFKDALDRVRRGDIDLLVLDVFDQAGAGAGADATDLEPVGRDVFDRIRTERFLPIVFLTALPDQVDCDKNPPFVQIVSKRADGPFEAEAADPSREAADPFEALFTAVKCCLDSPFPCLYRRVRSHIDDTSRRFMIDFVETHWNDLKDRPADVAHLLMRRLGASFDADAGQGVLADPATEGASATGSVPPIRYYLVPVPNEHRTGDIVTKILAVDKGEHPETRWHIVMSPSCDLVEGRAKAEYVVLAECLPLSSFGEHEDWITSDTASNTKRNKLEKLLKSNPAGGGRDRYFYLPAAWKVPDLLVDLQKIESIPYSDLGQYEKQASLDDPYAARLSHQFHCYLGRVGTPDLDLKAVLDAMRPQQ
ncbi:MAG: hypothetical protein OXE79_05170 [Acidimicrobiaceae bacterium]|nr:hypothetical protein [Acidimicrobiaceae bacterium]MCY4281080.1 hypothetical protein [Acidimicrobiaceae bacterium]MCY4295053.1 hypothetical protein [Acidimicrobiaceae bacterium]